VCIALHISVAHNTAQNRSNNFLSYPPNNHHCSDDVYLREGGTPTHTDADSLLSILFEQKKTNRLNRNLPYVKLCRPNHKVCMKVCKTFCTLIAQDYITNAQTRRNSTQVQLKHMWIYWVQITLQAGGLYTQWLCWLQKQHMDKNNYWQNKT